MLGIKGVPLIGDNDLPDPNIIKLDPETDSLVQNRYDEAMKDPNLEKKNLYNSIDQGANSFGLLGGMGDAIKTKYGRHLAQDLQSFKTNEGMNLRRDQMTRYKIAQQAVIAKQQVTNDAFKRQMDAYNAREAARAQAIGSVIQIGATVGGFMAAGPMGAMAGNAAAGAATRQPMSMPHKQMGVTQPQGISSEYGSGTLDDWTPSPYMGPHYPVVHKGAQYA